VQGEKVWTLGIIFTVGKASLCGMAFILDEYNGHGSIERKYFEKHPRHTGWTLVKMINMSMQGAVKLEDQVCSAYLYEQIGSQDGQTTTDGLI